MNDEVKKGKKFRRTLLNWAVMGIVILITLVGWRISSVNAQRSAEERFYAKTNSITSQIQNRLEDYEKTLSMGVALFNSMGVVSRTQFHDFVQSLQLNKFHHGIQGIGFSEILLPEEKEAYIQKIRAEGFPDFHIKPEGERPLYSSITYLEPFDWRNQRAFGYDMFTEKVRRSAMEQAQNSGLATASGLVTLVQETEKDVQRGFLIYVPYFVPVKSTESKEKLAGFIYSPIRAKDMLYDTIELSDPAIQIQIYDSESVDPEALLFDSSEGFFEAKNQGALFTREAKILVGQRIWTLIFKSKAFYFQGTEKNLPLFIILYGSIASLLILFVMNVLSLSHNETERLAIKMTADLRKRSAELEKKLEELRRFNDTVINREERMIGLKKEINRLSQELGRETPFNLSFLEEKSP